MKFRFFGLSDIGTFRPNNEDVWLALPEIGFFAMADGMGGHQAGEVAAQETIAHLAEEAQTLISYQGLDLIRQLRSAIEKSNERVYTLGQNTAAFNGMGTTLCCLIWTDELIVYAHVGDSRIYRFRNQTLELLTHDHSFLNHCRKKGKEPDASHKNVITRAIGTTNMAHPEINAAIPLPNDLFFLCTDGLTDVLENEEIEHILRIHPELSKAASELIDQAKIKGSVDNITLLMVQKSPS